MPKAKISKIKSIIVELISLTTPRARLCFWALATAVIFVLPYRLFANLSLWQRLGWHSAPSIGLTRAYWLLIHGDISGAWHRNKLIFVVIAVGFPVLTLDLYKIINNCKISHRH